MRMSGLGNDKLMVLIPMAVVVGAAVILAGGPTQMLATLDRHLAEVFVTARDWLRAVI